MPIHERLQGTIDHLAAQQDLVKGTKEYRNFNSKCKQQIKNSISNTLAQHRTSFDRHIARRNTSAAWGMWSRLVVAGIHEGLTELTKDIDMPKVDYRRAYTSYGKPHFKRVAVFPPQSAESGKLRWHHSVTKSLPLLRQLRRVQHIS
eukprot:6829101-Karenia_brevis.AAC.1